MRRGKATQVHDVRFPIEVLRGVPVVAAPCEIDITSAPELRGALLEAAGRGEGTLVADRPRAQCCDASVLRVLLVARAHVRRRGGWRGAAARPACSPGELVEGVERVVHVDAA